MFLFLFLRLLFHFSSFLFPPDLRLCRHSRVVDLLLPEEEEEEDGGDGRLFVQQPQRKSSIFITNGFQEQGLGTFEFLPLTFLFLTRPRKPSYYAPKPSSRRRQPPFHIHITSSE